MEPFKSLFSLSQMNPIRPHLKKGNITYACRPVRTQWEALQLSHISDLHIPFGGTSSVRNILHWRVVSYTRLAARRICYSFAIEDLHLISRRSPDALTHNIPFLEVARI